MQKNASDKLIEIGTLMSMCMIKNVHINNYCQTKKNGASDLVQRLDKHK